MLDVGKLLKFDYYKFDSEMDTFIKNEKLAAYNFIRFYNDDSIFQINSLYENITQRIKEELCSY